MRDTLKTHIRSISHFCLLRHTCNVPPPVDSSAILSWQLSAPQYVPKKSCLLRNSTVSLNMPNSCLLRNMYQKLFSPQQHRQSAICPTVVCSASCSDICHLLNMSDFLIALEYVPQLSVLKYAPTFVCLFYTHCKYLYSA